MFDDFSAMPIFEFYSPQTHKIYSFFARSPGMGDAVPRCPDDPSAEMRKVVSSFAVTGRAKEPGDDPGADLDDPRMEAAMAEMEREFSGMDEENPDPRQMARLMKRMAALTGEKLPEAMEEMVARMERGEDPERLEEEFGDLLDAEGGEGPDGEFPGEGESASARVRRLLRRSPRRDPELYEMREFL
ncbi:MAG: FmdB family transcriptional regulator [Opitutales bacterium]|nr:FmdB family transcriptional regulator [Opitutales bacterium]